MNLNKFLYNHSYWLFIAFLTAAIIAFWPSYYSTLSEQEEPRNHTHGIGMTLWCLLLITQAILIKTKMFKWHKWIGWISAILVLFILISTINLLHHLLGGAVNISDSGQYFMALVLISLLAFLITYILGWANRKNPLIHARYMVATIFPMVTPISDRIIGRHFPELIPFASTINGRPILPSLGFYMVDALLLILILWDYKSHRTKYVFLTVLIINLIYQFAVLNFYKYHFWESFCAAFAKMPLS